MKRLQWLDAMRGFTMILVVAYHVAQFGFGENEKTSAALPFLMLFRMPLFFFVSGFLAYKANFEWTFVNTLRQSLRKLRVQVVPALIFICVFVTLKMSASFPDAFLTVMRSPTKSGYWFTWVLLQMFLIYYALCLVGSWVGRLLFRDSEAEPATSGRQSWQRRLFVFLLLVVIWTLSVQAYETLYLPKEYTYHKHPFFNYTSLVQTIRFMQFFLLGNIVRRYWRYAEKLFDSLLFFPLVAITAFVCCADIFRWHTMKMEWTNLPRTVAMYALLLMVVMFFRHYRSWFTSERTTGRVLQYIGTRTLDIYLLHFLLIPHLPFIGTWLNVNHPNFLLDILLSIMVALPVIAVCLLISKLLHTSPVLGKWLFGK